MFLRNWYAALSGLITGVTGGQWTNYVGDKDSIYVPTSASSMTTVSSIFVGKGTMDLMARIHNSAPYGDGVVFGTGDTPPTINDYRLSGDIITTLTGTVAKTTMYADDNSYAEITAIYTLTNSGSEPVTIKEVALSRKIAQGTSGAGYQGIVERTVLDVPVTIEAGGIGQVTYKIRLNYPTV